MTDATPARRPGRSGLIAGILLAVIGAVAAWQALGFDDQSRGFPLGLSTLLALTGLGIAAQSVAGAGPSSLGAYGQGNVAAAVLLLALWTLAFTLGVGFVLPTLILMGGLLWLCGLRRPAPLAAVAAVITLAAWLLFVAVLDIPLPVSLLPDAWQRF